LNLFRQNPVEEHTPNRGIYHSGFSFGHAFVFSVEPGVHANLYIGMKVYLTKVVGQLNFIHICEDPAIAFVFAVILNGKVVNTQHHVLRRADNRFAIGWFEQVL